jgi:DNA-binding transcriptional ArsR family regulator
MFGIRIEANNGLTGDESVEDALIKWLRSIGYMTEGYAEGDPRRLSQTVPVGIFMRCFLPDPMRVWTAREMAKKLKAHPATVYRHIDRLKEMNIVEEATKMSGSKREAGFRIRYGSLSRAWTFTETDIRLAMENYRKTVDALQAKADAVDWEAYDTEMSKRRNRKRR